jgi:tRNA (guanine10-N2)-dimethyltransferase
MYCADAERSMIVVRLFFLLSGEHENLPVSELKAILEAEDFCCEISEKLDQVVRLEADLACVKAVVRRAALTRLCGFELFSCEARMSSIIKAVQATGLDEVLKEKEEFAVRVKRVRNYASKVDLMTLERKLGELILASIPNAKVNLKKPAKTFVGILTNERFVFGVKLEDIPAKPFMERRPRKKPFFHPSAMQAKLARCMVNLAKPNAGELVVDPFCGTGTMLLEASLIGCRVLGFDIQRRMAKGTLRNLAYFKIKPEGVVVADARNLPLTEIGCVVTDPPYGISSTTRKRTIRQIVEELLMAVHGMLDKGRRVCMASPKTLKIGRIGTDLGYKHLESHLVYVHRSLTREIAVFERV